MEAFLPYASHLQQRGFLQFTCCCAMKGGMSYERLAPYDKILVDAPCSSDRHLLKASMLHKKPRQAEQEEVNKHLKGGAKVSSLGKKGKGGKERKIPSSTPAKATYTHSLYTWS
ncbi:nol1 nop2 sun family protein, partial [Cystoisospora suis]